MRWKAASAPRLRSSRPASSAVNCAASCCKPSRFCAQPGQLGLQLIESGFGRAVFGLQAEHLLALFVDCAPFGFARFLVARGLRRPLLEAPLHALRFGRPSA